MRPFFWNTARILVAFACGVFAIYLFEKLFLFNTSAVSESLALYLGVMEKTRLLVGAVTAVVVARLLDRKHRSNWWQDFVWLLVCVLIFLIGVFTLSPLMH